MKKTIEALMKECNEIALITINLEIKMREDQKGSASYNAIKKQHEELLDRYCKVCDEIREIEKKRWISCEGCHDCHTSCDRDEDGICNFCLICNAPCKCGAIAAKREQEKKA